MKPNMWKLVVTISLFAALALPSPSPAQNVNPQLPLAGSINNSVPRKCDLAGVWYGGSQAAQYMLTIIQNGGGNYTMIGAAAFTQQSLGYPVTTPFSNSIVKLPNNRSGWSTRAMAFPHLLLNSGLHGTARFTNCETLRLDYDFFGGYFIPTNNKPFISSPDYVVVPPPFSEIYNRMPTNIGRDVE